LVVNTDGGNNINDEHYAVAGVFDLPHDMAVALLRFPTWRAPTEDEAAAHMAARDVPAPEKPRAKPRKATAAKA
jgi:hypothetical protein